MDCRVKRRLLLSVRFWPKAYQVMFKIFYPSFPVGRGSYGQPDVREWGEGARLSIGSFCSIADNVTIFLGGEHHTEWVTTYPFPEMWACAKHYTGHPKTKGDVIIGNDVWVGSGATILSGVSVGDGAVIGCQAVVGRDVEPYSIVCGNPAKPVRKRFPEEIIERLRRTAWWTWPDKAITDAMPLLLSGDMDGFFRFAEKRNG